MGFLSSLLSPFHPFNTAECVCLRLSSTEQSTGTHDGVLRQVPLSLSLSANGISVIDS